MGEEAASGERICIFWFFAGNSGEEKEMRWGLGRVVGAGSAGRVFEFSVCSGEERSWIGSLFKRNEVGR